MQALDSICKCCRVYIIYDHHLHVATTNLIAYIPCVHENNSTESLHFSSRDLPKNCLHTFIAA